VRIWRPACSAARRKASRSPAATYLLAPSNMHPHAGEGREGPGPARDNRNTGDFRAWKDHDAYQRTLERLLRDLCVKADENR
jgi:hypothetical protein